MDKQYFTVDEANAMIPQLHAAFARIMQLRVQLKLTFRELDEQGYAPEQEQFEVGLAGAPPDVLHRRAVLKAMMEALGDELGAMQDLGCMIKDLETGLVDWLALREGRDVLLCWRFGEKEVSYWHDIECGYGGRRPVSEL